MVSLSVARPAGEPRSRAIRLPLRDRSPVRSTAAVDLAGCTDVNVSSCRKLSARGRNRWQGHPGLAEQTAAIDPSRLGKSVGFLSFDEMRRIDAALRIVLDL